MWKWQTHEKGEGREPKQAENVQTAMWTKDDDIEKCNK